MLFKTITVFAAIASIVKANPFANPEPLAWGQANPEAEAAAQAYAEAYAEAIAISHPDPEAYALAASADDCASIACHAACGYLILNAAACSENTTDTYSGPYNLTCLCSDDSNFIARYPSCMACGWTLWKYYGPYVTSALEACTTLSTEPTGTLRCSTTLSSSYTKEANAGCAYGGACVSSTASGDSSSYSNSTSSDSGSSSGSSTVADETSSASSSASEETSTANSSSSSSSAAGAQLMAAGSSVFAAAILALLI